MKFIKTFLYNLIVKATRWGRIQTNYKLITQELLTVGKYTYGIENINAKIYKGSEAKIVICTGSIVTKDIPDFSIVAGVPAKVLKYRFNKENIKYLNNIKWWNWPEDKIEKNIKLLSSPNLDNFLSKHKNTSNEKI